MIAVRFATQKCILNTPLNRRSLLAGDIDQFQVEQLITVLNLCPISRSFQKTLTTHPPNPPTSGRSASIALQDA